MKRCRKCSQTKPYSLFHKNKSTKDGYGWWCKDCSKIEGRKYYLANKDKYRELTRKWRKNNKERTLELNTRSVSKCIETRRAYGRNYKNKYPKKYKCRMTTHSAIENGSLIRPDICSVCCGTDKYIQAHHDNYDRPLEVVWLCNSCHNELHKQLRDTERNLCDAE